MNRYAPESARDAVNAIEAKFFPSKSGRKAS